MQLVVNDQPITCPAHLSITELLQQLDRHQPGSAVAVNQRVIPQVQWASHQLNEGDAILLFQAIAGG